MCNNILHKILRFNIFNSINFVFHLFCLLENGFCLFFPRKRQKEEGTTKGIKTEDLN